MTEWSSYQNDIFTFVKKEKGSALIEAVAGSGKTTTILEALNHLPFSADSALFLAFNKSIADELRNRVPNGVEARTFNSLGNSAVHNALGSKMNPKKMNEFIKKNASDDLKSRAWGPLSSLIRLAKSSGLGVRTPNSHTVLWEIVDAHALDLPHEFEKEIIQLASRAVDWSLRETSEHDFDDQLLFPLYFDLDLPTYEIVFVDEAQDLSPLQHDFLSKLLDSKRGRLIAVGDTHQAIYGFRGADANSMNELRRRFSTRDLPLSVTYRCPERVVEKAQAFAPHILPSSFAIPGECSSLPQLPELEDFDPECMVLCRTNAPLMALAMRFLRRRLPVYVMGNFGDNIIKFLKRFKAANMPEFWQELDDWYNREAKDAEEKEQYNRLATLRDKRDSIAAVADGAGNPSKVIERFETLFEPKNAPKLGTIHKGKGTEADYVYLIHPEKLPFHLATQDWELEQEKNLEYVAITRAKKGFYYIHEPEGEE